jgi:hypothetical protein
MMGSGPVALLPWLAPCEQLTLQGFSARAQRLGWAKEAEMRMACCKVARKWHTEGRSVTLRGAVNTLIPSGDPLRRSRRACLV